MMALVKSTEFDAVGLANAVELSDYGLKLADLTELKRLFEHATTFGSLIQVPESLAEKLPALKRLSEASSQDILVSEALKRLVPLVQQAELLAAKYDAVVANPPYLNSGAMNPVMKKFARDQFPDAKSDVFACFIERATNLAREAGRVAIVAPYVWMFISSYERLRTKLITEASLTSLIQLEYNAFEPACIPVATFTLRCSRVQGFVGSYIDLSESKGHQNQAPKTLEAIENPDRRWHYLAASSDFGKLPGSQIAFSLPPAFLAVSKAAGTVGDLAEVREGFNTGDNDRFLRRWFEVPWNQLQLDSVSIENAIESGSKWFPCNKGGGLRRWFGNNDFVVNWENDGHEIRNLRDKNGKLLSSIKNTQYFFREGATWSGVGSSGFGARYFSRGFTFNSAGRCLFSSRHLRYLLALLNSAVSNDYLRVTAPTLSFTVGNIASVPALLPGVDQDFGHFDKLAKRLVQVTISDWDAYERSWDFHSLPLLSASTDPNPTLESSYTAWIANNKQTIAEMKLLEEENNRLFIDAYGLQDELTPDVPIEQITLTVNPAYRYGGNLTEDELWNRFRQDTIKELLSYATGCMMGRYSLDHPGLILANAGETIENYYAKIGKSSNDLTFRPDPDGIIPVLDGEWFEDDIVARTREFLAVTFPESSVGENLRFIEDSLGKDIRKYFCSEFYKDHLQTYKKRPIYWMVQSPKKGFSCLIYLHRYTKDTLNQVLNNYFRPYLQKLEARLAQLGLDQLNDALPVREHTAARKEAEKITKVLKECQAWEQDALLPLAQQRIPLDLDDGVKVNYLKLQDVLAPIPGLAAKED